MGNNHTQPGHKPEYPKEELRKDEHDVEKMAAKYLLQEQLSKEYQIALEEMGIVRHELRECVRTEGVNQFTNCKEIRDKYWALCKDKYKGMVLPPGFERAGQE
jgi:hypothetical protein